jgi:hypothetical protein
MYMPTWWMPLARPLELKKTRSPGSIALVETLLERVFANWSRETRGSW